MEYEIYAIGDPAFLAETLRAATTILDRDGMGGIIAIGFLVTFIWTIVQGVLSGGKEIKIQNIVIAGLIYAAFFGVRVDRVNVWPMHGLDLYQVEDVPLGLAFSGSTISKVGNSITRWFEQEFTVPGTVNSEFGSAFALKALYEMRGLGFQDGSLRWDPNGHFTKTLQNYVRNCVIPGTTLPTNSGNGEYRGLPAINLRDVNKEENAWEHLKWNNQVYTTLVYPFTNDPTPATVAEALTCADAYDKITTTWVNNPQVISTWLGDIGEATCNEAGYACNEFKTASGQFDDTKFQNRFLVFRDSLLNLDVGLDKMMMNRALGGALYSVGGAQALSGGDVLLSAITTKASAQITSNQALQQTMFEKMMLPLMTFFEALMYVAAPFAAILVAFGLGGLQMIGKYLVFALWIQLWKPVAAVGNMFITMSISGEMQNLNDFAIASGESMAAIANQPEVFDQLQHWIGVGGMLVASTPMITLMLMYGSAVTASSLAGRIDMGKGADVGMDDFKGKSQVGDATASLTKETGNVAMGNQQTSDAAMGAISMGAAYGNQAQTQRGIAETESAKAEKARGNALEAMTAAGVSVANRTSTAEVSKGEFMTSQEYAQQETDKLVSSGEISQSDSQTVSTGINAKASAGADLGKLMSGLRKKGVDTSAIKRNSDGSVNKGHLGMVMSMLGGKVEGGAEYQDKFNEAAAKTEKLSDIVDKSWSEGQSERNSWTHGFTDNNEKSLTDTKEWKNAEKHSQTESTSRAKARQAEAKATTAESMSNSAGFQRSFEVATLAADVNNKDSMSQFSQFLDAKKNQGDNTYAGLESSVGGYRGALEKAMNSGKAGDLRELLSMAGHDVPQAQAYSAEGMFSAMMQEGGPPNVDAAGGTPTLDSTQNQAAASLSQGVQKTLEGAGGASDKQMQQIQNKADRPLSDKEKKAAGQAAALASAGGMSTKDENAMREMLGKAGVRDTTGATSGTQLALAVAGMGEKLAEGMSSQEAFDASLAETQQMADLGESVGSTGSGADQGAAEPLTSDGSTGGDSSGSTDGNSSGSTGGNSSGSTGGNSSGSAGGKNGKAEPQSKPQQSGKGLDFLDSKGAKNAAAMLEPDKPLTNDGSFDLGSMSTAEQEQARADAITENPQLGDDNLRTQGEHEENLQDQGHLEGEMQGPEKDQSVIDGEKQAAFDNSEIREPGGAGKAMMDFLDTGIIQQAAARSGDGANVGTAVGGAAGAVSAVAQAQALKQAGKSVAMGVLRGAVSGAFRGGAWGAVAGAAYGAAEGYMAYQDTVDQAQKDKAGQELKAAQGNGDFSQITNASQEVINSTLEGVIAKQVVAMDQAAAQGEEFDPIEFRNNELDTFEQQVFDQGDALLSSGQGYADGLGESMATAVDEGLEWRQSASEEAQKTNDQMPDLGSL